MSQVGSRNRMALWLALVAALALVAVAASAPPATAQVSTMGAQGCNGSVCIDVDGSGLTVTNWRTTAAWSGYKCETAYFWRNSGVIRTQSGCGTNGASANWSSPGNFSDGDKLCNTWSDVSGKPCITIHA